MPSHEDMENMQIAYREFQERYMKKAIESNESNESNESKKLLLELKKQVDKRAKQIKANDIALGLKDLCKKYDQRFKLSDLFQILNNALQENFTLEEALNDHIWNEKYESIYLLVDENDKIYGASSDKELVIFYKNQIVGSMIKEIASMDGGKPVVMASYEINWITGSIKILSAFHTFDIKQFRNFPHNYEMLEAGNSLTRNEIEHCIVCVEDKEEEDLRKFVLSTKAKWQEKGFKFLITTNRLYEIHI